MDNEHWFDRLNKVLVRDAPRRALLGAAATVVTSLVLGDAPLAEAVKKKKKKKGKRDGKKDKPNPPPSCSGGACAAEPQWVGNDKEINHCEFVCRQCDGADPREFCIRTGFKPDGTPTKVADCCDEGEECCSGLCCGSSTNPGVRCCDGECVDTRINPDHCNGCNQPCPTGASCVDGDCRCPEGQIVCDGACVTGTECPDDGCHESCVGPVLACCDGDCVNITVDEENCGGCGLTCIEPGLQCCAGSCVDPMSDQNHCGGCGNRRPGLLCCNQRFYDPTTHHCCPNEACPHTPHTTVCCIRPDGYPGCCRP